MSSSGTLGLSVTHPTKKGQVEKQRVSSSGGTVAKGEAGMGQEKGLIPMRLGKRDFSDLGDLWLNHVWKKAFKPC